MANRIPSNSQSTPLPITQRRKPLSPIPDIEATKRAICLFSEAAHLIAQNKHDQAKIKLSYALSFKTSNQFLTDNLWELLDTLDPEKTDPVRKFITKNNEPHPDSADEKTQKLGTKVFTPKIIIPLSQNKPRSNCEEKNELTPTDVNYLRFNENKGLKIHNTVGDGSCAIHALIGDIDTKGRGYYYDSHQELRNDFCQWLGERFLEGKLPNSIKSALQDHIEQPQNHHIPPESPFQKYLDKNLFNTPNDKADAKEMVTTDYDCFFEYCKNFQKSSHYLLQEELVTLSNFLYIKLVLIQKGWGNDSNKITATTFDKNGNPSPYLGPLNDMDTAYIFHSGLHYERAEFFDI